MNSPARSAGIRALRGSPLIWLLLGAFYMRALVPVGFMPGFDQGAPLVLCTSDGLIAVAADSVPSHPAQAHEECPFAFALSMAGAPTAAGTAQFSTTADAQLFSIVAAPPAATESACYSARAPPHFV